MKHKKIFSALDCERIRNRNFQYRNYDVCDPDSRRPVLWIVAFDPIAQRRVWITEESSQYCITVDKTDERGKNKGNPYHVFCSSQKAVVEELHRILEIQMAHKI